MADDVEETDAATFESLGISEPILRTLIEIGYEAPTPIQEKTIPPMLAGRAPIGQAQTGTGKTAAFAIPILEKLDPAVPEVQALVLAPTRELAIQVAEAIHPYSKYRGRGGGPTPPRNPAGGGGGCSSTAASRSSSSSSGWTAASTWWWARRAGS